jgi:D-sedoheptulose 7-phosphate isomerase
MFAEDYYGKLSELVKSIKVTGKEKSLNIDKGVEAAGALILKATGSGNKLMFIGNGGSAAICSHMAIDFWKNGGMRAIAFNDSPLLTCVGNDYGYRHVFEKPIEMFADRGDLLVAISSSGCSENILRGAQAARSRGCGVITLSGFKEDNPLRAMGDLNFHVPSEMYGPVEVIHHSICHCMLDSIMLKKGKLNREDYCHRE